MLSATDMRRALPPLVCATMLAALWLVFMAVPTEREMGIVQRIFYFHVASAWVAFLGFFLVAGASAVYLWNGAPTADRLAYAGAEVGVLFCTLVLVTGPIWARPIWGVWWTWDPRLTMTVVLWAIYSSYLMLRAFGGGDAAIARYAAVLGIVGVLDIPLIVVSVRLLRGIHPAVITRTQGGTGLADRGCARGCWYPRSRSSCSRRGWSACAYEARSSRTRWRRCVGRWMRAAGRWHEVP